MGQTVAQVYVEKAVYSIDRSYSYAVPETMCETLCRGCRVVVPFGGGNRKIQGIVSAVETHEEENPRLKPVAAQIDEKPLLTDEMFGLIGYLTAHTFCTCYEAVKAMLPAGMNVSVTERFVPGRPLTEEEAESLPGAQQKVLDYLQTGKTEGELRAFLKMRQHAAKSAVVRALLSAGLIEREEKTVRKAPVKTVRRVAVHPDFDGDVTGFSQKQCSLLSTLEKIGEADPAELCAFCGVTEAVLKALVRKGAAVLYIKEAEHRSEPVRNSPDCDKLSLDITLSDEQEQAFQGILALQQKEEANCALLCGVTGSGKTQVYIKLIERALAAGKTAMLLVPEIALTPQLSSKFVLLFGDLTAVIHSGLSQADRMRAYERIQSGEARIVIGTRSAVFSPLSDLALIILDEEGEGSYKSDASPRYHARDIAKWRCGYHKATLLLGSATPSVDSRFQAERGRYRYFELKNRFAQAALPEVYLVDMRTEQQNGNFSFLSEVLKEQLRLNLEANEQSVLLLNRRGYQPYATCMSCGEVMKCPSCDVALTYHKANGHFLCHYCGHAEPEVTSCPKCGGVLKRTGAGTQRIEETLEELLPGARILRMDTDTTGTRGAYEKKLRAFGRGDYDIMVGTQMIAKGLDFPNVTLAGVLNGDAGLGSGDYRSGERVFSLITQVVGRSGRGEKSGRAYIQTFDPENPVIVYAAQQNYDAFYKDEIEMRRVLLYPPFCDLLAIGVSGTDEQAVKQAAQRLCVVLREETKDARRIVMKLIGITPAAVYRVSGKFRYRAVIKCRMNREFREIIARVLRRCGKEPLFQKISIFADVNGELL